MAPQEHLPAGLFSFRASHPVAVLQSSLLSQMPGLKVLDLETVSVFGLSQRSRPWQWQSPAYIGAQGVESLAAALSRLPLLQTLNLSGLGLEGDSMATLAPSLRSLVHLRRLDLRYTNLGFDSLASMADFMSCLLHLEHLGLAHNYFQDEAGDERDSSELSAKSMEVVAAFAASLKHLTRLETLDMRWSYVTNPGMVKVMEKAVADVGETELLLQPAEEVGGYNPYDDDEDSWPSYGGGSDDYYE